jgi:hypothetical protein
MSRDTHLPQCHDVAFDGVVQTIPGSTKRFSRHIKWTICIGFSVDFTLNMLLA